MIRVVLVAVVLACGGSRPTPAPAPPPPPPADAAVADAAPEPPPPECTEYLAALQRLQDCPKMASAREQLRAAVESLKQGLAGAMQSSPEARAQLVKACTQGGEALAQAAKSAGC
jgi:hypothetical protein